MPTYSSVCEHCSPFSTLLCLYYTCVSLWELQVLHSWALFVKLESAIWCRNISAPPADDDTGQLFVTVFTVYERESILDNYSYDYNT